MRLEIRTTHGDGERDLANVRAIETDGSTFTAHFGDGDSYTADRGEGLRLNLTDDVGTYDSAVRSAAREIREHVGDDGLLDDYERHSTGLRTNVSQAARNSDIASEQDFGDHELRVMAYHIRIEMVWLVNNTSDLDHKEISKGKRHVCYDVSQTDRPVPWFDDNGRHGVEPLSWLEDIYF